MWLQVKFYKTGENRKLAPRYSGPWTEIQNLANGVNFEIRNPQTSEKKIAHHDRLIPFKSGTNEDGVVEFDTVRNQVDNDTKTFGENPLLDILSSSWPEEEEDISINSDMLDEFASDLEDSNSDNATPPKQYPRRVRRPREFYGNIP